MLEKLGFTYHMRVDPFDGGPHIEAPTDSISLVKQTNRVSLGKPFKDGGSSKAFGIVSILDQDGEFVAAQSAVVIDRQGRLCLPQSVHQMLGAKHAQDGLAGLTLLDPPLPLIASKSVPGKKR